MGNKRNRNKDKDKTPFEFKITQKWEELDNLYNSIGLGIIDIYKSINSCAIALAATHNNTNMEVISTINGAKKDLEIFSTELVGIKNKHKDYSGIIKNEDELALCISIFNEYFDLNERFKAIVFMPMLTMTEFISELDKKNTVLEPNDTKLTEIH